MKARKKYFSSANIFLLSLFIFLCSFSDDKNICYSEKQEINDSCEIIPYIGIGNIVLGKSNINDVEKIFGKGVKHKEWAQAGDLPLHKRFSEIAYPQLGLKFIEYRDGLKRFTVQEIYITDSCKCKTKMGVGIGSALDDLKREFGDTITVVRENGRSLVVFLIPASGGMIEFYCYSTMDTSKFKVEEIDMSN